MSTPGVPAPGFVHRIGEIVDRRRGVEFQALNTRSLMNRLAGTAMPFGWTVNPFRGCEFGCRYCYARPTHEYLGHCDPDEFEDRIYVKRAGSAQLAADLKRARDSGQEVAIGAATDPYQPAEGRYKLTRACLEMLRDASNSFSIITRGPMIVRDLDLLVESSQRASVSVTFSVPTVDEEVWKRTEPSTAHPRQRLKAVKELVDAGVNARVGMAPILPGISDRPEQLREVVRAAREAGATGIWANLLFLKPGTREHFLEHLAEDWPEQVPLYEELYERKAYLGADLMKPVRNEVSRLARQYAIRDRRKLRLTPPPEPEQLSLTV